jgi:hypothetical protein
MLRLLGFRTQGVKRKDRSFDSKDLVDQIGAISFGPGKITYALCEPFCGLKHGVEIIVLEQFGPTVPHHFRMEAPPVELCLQGPCFLFGF